jgi:hypothetical protein
MRDEQWDVFWSQVYWLAAIALAALPLLLGIWVDAQGAGWLRALEEHYKELVAYTMLLTAIAAAESRADGVAARFRSAHSRGNNLYRLFPSLND